jgi:hypothetical protein
MSSVSTGGAFSNLDAARDACFVPPPEDEKFSASIRDSISEFLHQIAIILVPNERHWTTQTRRALQTTQQWLENSIRTSVSIRLDESFSDARKRFDRITMSGTAHPHWETRNGDTMSRITVSRASDIDHEILPNSLPSPLTSENQLLEAEMQLGTNHSPVSEVSDYIYSQLIAQDDFEAWYLQSSLPHPTNSENGSLRS